MSDDMPPLAIVPGTAEKILSRIDASGDCWEWTGTTCKNGYGTLNIWGVHGAGASQAHRLIWEVLVGSIPPDFEVDHRCFNPGCVNPDHLEGCTRSLIAKELCRVHYKQEWRANRKAMGLDAP